MKLVKSLPKGLKESLKKVPLLEKAYIKFIELTRNDYQEWISNKEAILWLPTDSKQTIRFSVVVPIYNPALKLLIECIESVKAQSYSNWQLVLVNDASTSQEVIQYLSELDETNTDERIIVVSNEQNLHISLTTNEGLKHCSGQYVAFLDHDDLLAPYALNEVAVALAENPDVKWLYSDEDLINESGKRIIPHFKSDWNPYLLQAHNYITHLCVYERNLLAQLGGCRVGFEGAQDYDLALRASEALKPEQIQHIPKVLYHWRMHKESTASQSGAKPYTVEAGRKALAEHLQRKGISASVKEASRDNFYKVDYLVSSWPKVSVIIPTRDNRELLEACISSIFDKTDYPDFELVVMDNQTQEPSALAYLQALQKNSRVNVIPHNKTFNYSEINNVAVEHSEGSVVVLLNNDTEVINSQWLKELVSLAVQPDVGCVGAKLLYSDDTIQHAGVIMGLGGYAAHSHRCTPNHSGGYFNRPHVNQALSAVTGACLAIRKDVYLEVGGLDEAFQVAYNDVDFCLKVQQAGYYNVYCAHAELYHYESKTRGDDNSDELKAARFDKEKQQLLNKWPEQISNDPYYNPNLTRSAENFSINNDY